jgi:hypothetical protein
MTTDEPNQGATGEAPETPEAEPTGDSGPAGAGAPINQGAPGSGPSGMGPSGSGPSGSAQSPLSAQGGSEFVDEHPEALVGAAFVGGFALAQILKQFGE